MDPKKISPWDNGGLTIGDDLGAEDESVQDDEGDREAVEQSGTLEGWVLGWRCPKFAAYGWPPVHGTVKVLGGDLGYEVFDRGFGVIHWVLQCCRSND